jgi:hypothetical protein
MGGGGKHLFKLTFFVQLLKIQFSAGFLLASTGCNGDMEEEGEVVAGWGGRSCRLAGEEEAAMEIGGGRSSRMAGGGRSYSLCNGDLGELQGRRYGEEQDLERKKRG